MEERDTRHAVSPGFIPAGLRTPSARRLRGAGAALLACFAATLTGCTNWDSYLDPSVVGRWERTPTIVPILEHIAEIEEATGAFSEYTEVQPEDLLPEPATYAIAPGDVVTLQLWDLVVRGQPVVETNVVDATGAVDVIQIGRVDIAGLNEQQAAERVAARMRPFVADPLVSVTIESRREQAFQLSGAVLQSGSFQIPSGDYRLLEALITAGGVAESAPFLYIIRQVSIADAEPARPDPVEAGTSPGNEPGRVQPFPTAPSGRAPARPEDADVEDLIDIIEDLSGPDGGAPVAMGTASSWAQPGSAAPDPVIDLVEEDIAGEAPPPSDAPTTPTRWVFRDGQWVQVAGGARPGSGDGLGELPAGLLTQRIIRVPVEPLLNGDARFNIVVRPGDVIRVPPPETGNIYMQGQINRPGVYTLPNVGRLTLTRAIAAAGGLGGLAIPERVDLTRMIGNDRQATVMLNYRAIAQGTQPDVFMRRDDIVNIGTNFWAFPLAVVRNGFRASYGFGFLLDRNFGNDVFGAPPVNNQFGGGGNDGLINIF